MAWNTIIEGMVEAQDEKRTEPIIQEGKQYPAGDKPLEEGTQYNWSPDEHLLLLFFHHPMRHEEQAVKFGKAELGLVIEQDIIFLLYRFHEARKGQKGIDWSDAPYTWHLLPPESRRLPPSAAELSPEERIELHVVLVDVDTGIVLVIRRITLSHDFTALLYQAIRHQASRLFDENAYDHQLDQVYAKYSAEDLVSHALVICEDKA